MIALVTDSNAQLPPELGERYRVTVVPLEVTVDGERFLEGVDLDADAFYARFAGGRRPEVATSQPSPGRFAAVFEDLAGRGADQILAVHVGSSVSGTVNSARLAAEGAAVPVRVVDTGTASFGVACCVWEAGEVLASGGSLDEAASVAEQVGVRVGTVFTVGALDLARAGGRLAGGAGAGGRAGATGSGDAGGEADAPGTAGVIGSGGTGGETGTTGTTVTGDAGGAAAGIPVLTMVDGKMQVVRRVEDLDAVVDAMAAFVVAAGFGLRAAVGVADEGAAPLALALEERLARADEVREVVRYRIGPSVGAHTGPGTAGAYFYRSGR